MARFCGNMAAMVTPEESLMGEQAVTKVLMKACITQYTKPWNMAASIQYSCFAYIKWNRSFCHMALKDNNRKRFNFGLA
ncbi:MAG: hypothetical protein CM15mP31_2110 [Gammaproteobacteria bacterium]|nr:MAG: hypothetical protein CM15mP31_2110 [Gammaproteobacteria bacterium]